MPHFVLLNSTWWFQSHLKSPYKKGMSQVRLEDGKLISGKGRLTNNETDRLQVYYGKVIQSNTHDFQSIENAVILSVMKTQTETCVPPWRKLVVSISKAKGKKDYRNTHPKV